MTFAARNAKGVLQSLVNIAVFVDHFQSSQKDRYHYNDHYLIYRRQKTGCDGTDCADRREFFRASVLRVRISATAM